MLRVLCLDHEGGHGGSSRSLYQSIDHMDRRDAEVEVWCRRQGVIQERYARIGVTCRPEPWLPRFTVFSEALRDNLSHMRDVWPDFWRARPRIRRLAATIERRFDLVHFNHPAFFLLARWLRPRCRVPFVMHVRTRPPDSALARWQARTITRVMDHLVFITENERDHLAGLAGGADGTVIHNIQAPPPRDLDPHPDIPRDGRLKVASLSNLSWHRGVDRLVDVAAELAAAGRRDVLFVMAGAMRLTADLARRLGRGATPDDTLADHVEARGLSDMFVFLGHVDDPERVLIGCDVLAKLTREANPWGRDIIEALAFGRPVLSCGDWTLFVETGATGFLYDAYDAATVARDLVGLADDRDSCRRMGEAGRERVAELCDGPARAADLKRVWEGLCARPGSAGPAES